MDESQIRAFVEITRKGSFTAAAESLHLTQPAISKRIVALENQLGSQLFDRVGREAKLTETGRDLLPMAENMLLSFSNIRKMAVNMKNQVRGTLQLGTSHHVGLHRLPPVLRSFSKRYPDVELALRFIDSEEGVKGVASGELELALITLPSAPPDNLEVYAVWDDPLAVVVSNDHPLAGRHSVSIDDLSQHEAILPGTGTYTRALFEERLLPLGLELKVGLSTNFLETNKMMASIGLGWTVLPQTMLDDSVRPLQIRNIVLQRKLGYVTHRGMTLSNAAAAMTAILQAI